MFVVELQSGLYLAPWSGDPGRTYDLNIARKYQTERGAKIALGIARKQRPFKNASIVKLSFNRPEDTSDNMSKSITDNRTLSE